MISFFRVSGNQSKVIMFRDAESPAWSISQAAQKFLFLYVLVSMFVLLPWMLSLCLGIKISGGRQQFIGTLSLDLYTTVKTPVVIANVACGCPANRARNGWIWMDIHGSKGLSISRWIWATCIHIHPDGYPWISTHPWITVTCHLKLMLDVADGA